MSVCESLKSDNRLPIQTNYYHPNTQDITGQKYIVLPVVRRTTCNVAVQMHSAQETGNNVFGVFSASHIIESYMYYEYSHEINKNNFLNKQDLNIIHTSLNVAQLFVYYQTLLHKSV
jgi:hypothetical protein